MTAEAEDKGDSLYEFLSGTAENIASWECFKLYRNDRFIRISSQGKEFKGDPKEYLTCEEEINHKPIKVCGYPPRAWENFIIYEYDQNANMWVNILNTEDTLTGISPN